MEFLKDLSRFAKDTVNTLSEKSRKAAYLNRIRTVIRCEERAAEKEYRALGRYYYNNLRDPDNAVAEPHCSQLDAIEERLDAALQQLEQFYADEAASKREDVDLSDVQCLDGDPEEEAPASEDEPEAAPEEIPEAPAEPEEAPEAEAVPPPVWGKIVPGPAAGDENEELPFE